MSVYKDLNRFVPERCFYQDNSLEVVGLPRVPVFVGDGLAGGHPEELALLCLVGAARPEVLVAHT